MLCKELNKVEELISNANGLVFDCDGTLLDTMPIYYDSWKRTCDEIGLNFPIDRFYYYAGMPVIDIFKILIEEQKPRNDDNDDEINLTAEHCEERKKQHHADIEAEGKHANAIDVVVNIAMNYHGKIPMAVASSGWRDHVIKGLERSGIIHLFDTIVTADEDDVKQGKPHPDIFLVAAERLGVKPETCIGFEDADLGMKALESAGYMYACDVRLFHMYPRNIEKRLSTMPSSSTEKEPSFGNSNSLDLPTLPNNDDDNFNSAGELALEAMSEDVEENVEKKLSTMSRSSTDKEPSMGEDVEEIVEKKSSTMPSSSTEKEPSMGEDVEENVEKKFSAIPIISSTENVPSLLCTSNSLDLPTLPSNDDDNFNSARELALQAMAEDREDFFSEEMPLSEKQVLQSILLAEDAANSGAAGFTTKDKIHHLERVHVPSPPKDDERKGSQPSSPVRRTLQFLSHTTAMAGGAIKELKDRRSRPASASISKSSHSTGTNSISGKTV